MIGYTVFWSLAGDADPAGLSNPPPLPGALTALRRALRAHKAPPGKRVLPPRPVASGALPGLAVVTEIDAGGSLTHTTTEVITIDPVTDVPSVEWIAEEYRKARTRLTADDIRVYLAARLRQIGVALRDHGGVYFVPSVRVAELECLTEELRRAMPGSVLHRIRAADASPESIAALVSILASETEGLGKELSDGLGDTNARGRRTRIDQADTHLGLLESFENSLGVTLDSLRTSMNGIRGLIVLEGL